MSTDTSTLPATGPEPADEAPGAGGRLGPVTVLGEVVGGVFGLVSRVRRAARPLHPIGSVGTGVLTRHGSTPRCGIDWIDEPGDDEVLLRVSRSVGVPAPGPDVFGLALRVPVGDEGSYGDVLFSGSGTGRLSRFVLLPGWAPSDRAMGTLLPYLSPGGPLLLLADPTGETTFALRWAVGRGPWTRFATLEVEPGAAVADDAPISFDPVRHTLPGLTPYPWVRRLREPSYRTARQHRGLPD